MRIGCNEHAVDAYTEAYQRTQPDKRYEILKGRAYNKHCVGHYIGAIDDLTEVIALQPDNRQRYTRRGITRGETGDYQGAINDFDKAAAIAGLNADLHNLLAHAHMHAALAQINDENVDVHNTGTARHVSASSDTNEGAIANPDATAWPKPLIRCPWATTDPTGQTSTAERVHRQQADKARRAIR